MSTNFKLIEAIKHLNALAEDSIKGQVTMRTTEEVLHFLKNPPKRAYSVPLEEARTSVVTLFWDADTRSRREIVSSMNKPAKEGFLDYAANMAVLAIRTQSPILIEQGLIGLVIEGGSQDLRDSIVVLSKLYHSAAKLGLNAGNVFEKVASLADSGVMKREIIGFPLRPQRDRDLKAFYQAEDVGTEGFRYKSVIPGWMGE